ncbi:MAG: hypothetical protein HQ510_01050 [Candidatus Marinimicrobia bacterium]|nr:hypothetical protein [Candidatus Neomarinimicrobiota bacterium]
MLIVGSKGLGRDILGSLCAEDPHDQYYFFDNLDKNVPDLLFGRYRVYRTFEEVSQHFDTIGRNFITARGNPLKRFRINTIFKDLGGILTSVISRNATIGAHVLFGDGVIVQPEVTVSSNVIIGEGCFLNCDCIVAHDVTLGEYTTVQPGVKILGNVQIGKHCILSTNCVIMPHVKIGDKVRIGVGAIIDRNLDDNEKVGFSG